MLGELARAEGVIPENGGFSPQRWLFWATRLAEIEKSETVGEEEVAIATFARGVMNNMLNTVACSDSMMTRELARLLGSRVLSEVKIPAKARTSDAGV
jgi:hypothetical protein